MNPIWIIGVPRSGTTLSYQVICNYYNTAYLTNRIAKRYKIPYLASALSSNEFAPVNFKSEFGKTKLPNEPHEGGEFFYQFFPRQEPYTAIDDISKSKQSALKKVISYFTETGQVFVSKNTFHSLRINALNQVFPDSMFIWVKRDKLSVAYSILKAREKLNIPPTSWWSVKPPNWESMQHLSVVEKVIWQINEIESIIEHDLKKTDSKNITIEYADLCKNPRKVLRDISKTFDLTSFERESNLTIPESFTYSVVPDDALSREIKKQLDNE